MLQNMIISLKNFFKSLCGLGLKNYWLNTEKGDGSFEERNSRQCLDGCQDIVQDLLLFSLTREYFKVCKQVHVRWKHEKGV